MVLEICPSADIHLAKSLPFNTVTLEVVQHDETGSNPFSGQLSFKLEGRRPSSQSGWPARQFVRQPDVRPCWRNEPLEYQFRVAAPLAEGELSLAASEYRGGSLDWYHFRRAAAGDPLGAAGTLHQRSVTVLPTPLRFHGMPAARFWAIEDDLVS